MLYLRENNLVPEVGRTVKVQIPLYDVITVNHARRIETHKVLGFRSAVTQELVTEMRGGLGEELIRIGVIPAIPPLTNTDLLEIQGLISVDNIPFNIIYDACFYTDFTHSA